MELSWNLVAMVGFGGILVGYFIGRMGGGSSNVVQVPSGPPQRPNLQPGGGQWEEAARAQLAAGNKIMAIKLVRDATGLGLKEAKDLVESW